MVRHKERDAQTAYTRISFGLRDGGCAPQDWGKTKRPHYFLACALDLKLKQAVVL